MNRARCAALVAAICFLLNVSSMQAQWIMAAHAAKNHIQRMTQKSGAGGYDVATVLLEAAPAAVYDKALKNLQAHPEISISKNDMKAGQIEFRKGQQVAGLQITGLSDKLTQLMIASSVSESQPSATPLVVEAVMRVCKEVNVTCTVEP